MHGFAKDVRARAAAQFRSCVFARKVVQKKKGREMDKERIEQRVHRYIVQVRQALKST